MSALPERIMAGTLGFTDTRTWVGVDEGCPPGKWWVYERVDVAAPKVKDGKIPEFVKALTDDEGTKVGYPYRAYARWTDKNGGVGLTVELPDGSGAGLNEGEYVILSAWEGE